MTTQRKKEITILVFEALYSLLFFLTFSFVLQDGNWSALWGVALYLGAVVWLAITAASAAFLNQRPTSRIILSVMVIPIVWLAGNFSLQALVGAVFLALFISIARSAIGYELDSRVHFKTREIFMRGIRYLVVACAISLIALALPVVRQRVAQGDITVPEEYVNTVLRPLAPILGQFLPGYTEFATVDDLIDSQIEQQPLPPGETVTPEEKADVRDGIAQSLGVALGGDETVPEVSATLINRYLQTVTAENSLAVILVLIAVAFLAIRAAFPLVVWPTVGLTALIIFLSERIGLITRLKTQVTVERIHV